MENRAVKIYTYSDSPRLRFAADLILNEILGLSCEIVTDRRRLGKSPVINYSHEEISGAFWICPSSIMFEKGIVKREIDVNEWNGLPVFFMNRNGFDMPFDIFASSFYLVSRYEEYLENLTDEFGRFRSCDSLALQKGFNMIPVVDLWAREMSRLFVRKYPTFTFRKNEFRAIVSIDADEPFKFPGRNIIGNIGDLFRDITSRTGKPGRRPGHMAGTDKDPYHEAFGFISDECIAGNALTKFFFPLGNKTSYDKNPSWKNERYRGLINMIASKSEVGLHPSFNAGHDIRLLKTEKQRLTDITGDENRKSRFHFLRIKMPLSYRNLIEAGFTEDYSMGYTDEPGFRAGIARPFRFYDLLNDKVTDLRIYPFQFMDAGMKDNKRLSAGECRVIISNLIAQTKKVGGYFISIWHNTTLLDSTECAEWRDLFRFMLNEQET